LHVLAALEIERHRKKTLDQAASNATKAGGTLDGATNTQNIAMATAATLESLMMTSLDTQDGVTQATLTTTQGARKASRAFGNAWRGAAAYHYYMLAQRLFYSGNYDNAMKCSIKLCEYDDVLNPRDIYSLLALTAYFNKFYGICSQAFVKVPSPLLPSPFPLPSHPPLLFAQLETIPSIPEVERDKIETLAVKIFVKHSPVDPSILPEPYLKCLSMGKPYKACIITGRSGRSLLLPFLRH
jgi:WD repeat-containing protein 35